MSVAVVMPSGTGKTTDDHEFRVIDDGEALELTVMGHKLLTDPERLHLVWNSSLEAKTRTERTLRSGAFRPFLSSLRANASQNIKAKM